MRSPHLRYSLRSAIWRNLWGFSRTDVALVAPIARQLSGQRLDPNLNGHLAYLRRPEFHGRRFPRVQEALARDLKPFGLDIPILFYLLEPAVFFHTVWFYQMNRKEDGAAQKESKYRHVELLLRDQQSAKAADRIRPDTRAQLVRHLHRASVRDGYPLPNLEVLWNGRQRDLLAKHLGERLLAGEQVRSKKKPHDYAVHKAPIWKTTMDVLRRLMTSSSTGTRDPRQRDALVYRSLRFLFPDVFELDLPEAAAAKLVRERCRGLSSLNPSLRPIATAPKAVGAARTKAYRGARLPRYPIAVTAVSRHP